LSAADLIYLIISAIGQLKMVKTTNTAGAKALPSSVKPIKARMVLRLAGTRGYGNGRGGIGVRMLVI
jgi:hypothetical protein